MRASTTSSGRSMSNARYMRGGALRIGKVGQRQDVFQGERGNAFGHVQPASLRQPVDDGFREGDRTVCAPARVDVEVLSHVLHFLPNSTRVISDSSIKVSEHKINLEDHFFGFPQTCASRAPARGPLLPAFAVRRLPHHPLPIRAPAFASRHLLVRRPSRRATFHCRPKPGRALSGRRGGISGRMLVKAKERGRLPLG